jgi:hypothetical protein
VIHVLKNAKIASMKLLKFLPLLLLVACNGVVTQVHIDMATKLCEPNGGVHYISGSEDGPNWYSMTVACNNGAQIQHYWNVK